MISDYVRLATPEDIPSILGFMKSFHKLSPYRSMRFDTQKSKEFLTSVINGSLSNHVCLVALKDLKTIGFLTGASAEPVFSRAKIATELGWFIEPEFRGTRASYLIYSAYEDWAYRTGCTHIQAAFLPDMTPGLDVFYKKRGYTQVESSFIKTIRI